jgi:small-conductance mechanosensitive channel
MNNWSNIFIHSLSALGGKLMAFVPNLLGAILLLVIAIVVAGVVRKVVEKGLHAMGMDRLPGRFLGKEHARSFEGVGAPSLLIGKLAYWTILLVFLLTISETLGWTVVTEKTSELIGYMPRLFSAVIIFVVGYFIASFIRNALQAAFGSIALGSGRFVSRIAFYIILAFISVTALDQAGVDTTLLTANISIIIGAVMIAFSVAFAWAAKDLVRNILSFVYGRDRFQIGQSISFGDVNGKIISFDHMNVVLRNEIEDVVIPTRMLVDAQVRVAHGTPLHKEG